MFNSTISKIAKTSLVIAVLMGATATANADTLIPTDLTSNIEQNIATQMQGMMQLAQRELSMSLQAQLSSSMFDRNEAYEANQLVQEPKEAVMTSAMVEK
ncbi:hypothetical protein HWQ46_23950 [Shewanella sp. D64]|uniref:hypothetical protein n=1 Tax=unclassified Shewanella TaxID=196818 RepID=UPI0022BA4EF4|nr:MULTISPECIES: hypothetical protein [unclassified Shewanella]MEC4728578.1 hypothetical protein [Shewanella sp. D64]MEC4740512.1 hypothetical protein [Shewanella sp. E94]WBJ94821.1 hypothetical protein HWQ47_23740 [Shewanella sp. MTB7]